MWRSQQTEGVCNLEKFQSHILCFSSSKPFLLLYSYMLSYHKYFEFLLGVLRALGKNAVDQYHLFPRILIFIGVTKVKR